LRGVLLLILLLAAWPVEAAVADYIGKPIVEIRLQSNGADARDATLVEVIET